MSDTCKSASRHSRGLSNCKYLENMEKFCYPGETIGVRNDAVDSVITSIRMVWMV